MKKLFLGVLALAIGLLYVPTVQAGVNDFTISDYRMDMYLGRDSSGRSTLTTKERITAQFPNYDQNHGIERAIPTTYDGHTTSLKINTVEDLYNPNSSTHTPYSTYDSNGNKVLRIGDPDKYVYREHKYQIDYSQRDVTKYFADTKDDEFYWDTNGTDWRVPIDHLTVNVYVDDALAPQLNDAVKCYQGVSGASNQCELSRSGNTFTVQADNLQAGENVTVAVGFKPGTFAAYQPSLWEIIVGYWLTSLVITGLLSVVIGVMLAFRWTRARNRTKEVGTIVPEYIPPRDVSVTAAAEVLDLPRSTMTAQILDLAVRHYLRVYETRAKSTFKKAEYDLEIIKPIDDLKWEEQELIRDLFAGTVDVGTRMSMKTLSSSTAFYGRVQNNAPGLTKRIRGEYALREKNSQASRWFKKAGWVLLAASVVTLSPFLLADAIVSFVLGATLWRLSDKGLELRRYLLGLKDYIDVAEEERIKMLQSPEGAAKVGESVDTGDQSQLIKLYERVLPYAVLFGQEKQWNKQLGQFYETTNTQPDWYHGLSAFNAVNFASGMSSFATSAHYASPSSSSSGGSGGGGFSGGGGGGGGGGGW